VCEESPIRKEEEAEREERERDRKGRENPLGSQKQTYCTFLISAQSALGCCCCDVWREMQTPQTPSGAAAHISRGRSERHQHRTRRHTKKVEMG